MQASLVGGIGAPLVSSGTAAASSYITINYSPSSPAVGDTVNFSADVSSPGSAGEAYEYIWNIDGSTTTAETVTETFSEAGSHSVGLTVKFRHGPVQTETTTIDVESSGGSVDIDYSPSSPDVGDSVTFSPDVNPPGGAGEAYEYIWNIDGSTTTSKTVTETFSEAGSYSVGLTVKFRHGPVMTETTTVDVESDSGSVDIEYSPSNPDVDESVTFSADVDASTTPDSYSWSIEGSDGGSSESVTTSFSAAGSYDVSLTVNLRNGPVTTDSTSIVVGDTASDPPEVTLESTNVDESVGWYSHWDDAVELSASAQNVSGDVEYDWQWEYLDGDGGEDYAPTPDYTYSQELHWMPGDHRFSVDVISDGETVASDETTLTVVDSREAVSVESVTRPPTAVQCNSDVEFSFTLEAPHEAFEPKDFEAHAEVGISYRGRHHTDLEIPLENLECSGDGISLDAERPSEGSDLLKIEGELPDTTSLVYRKNLSYSERKGLKYEPTVQIRIDNPATSGSDGSDEADNEWVIKEDHFRLEDDKPVRTYAFEYVETIDVLPSKFPDKDAENLVGGGNERQLFDELRKKAEDANQFFASGMGTMGAEGRAFRFPTEQVEVKHPEVTLQEGWIELPATFQEYDLHDHEDDSDVATPEDVAKLRNKLDRLDDSRNWGQYEDFDETEPVLEHTLKLALMSSEVDTRPDSSSLVMIVVGQERNETRASLGNPFMSSGDIGDSGEIYDNVIYDMANGDAWTHEIGHDFGLPDLYDEDGTANNIEGWGLMGGSWTSTSYTAYSRFVSQFGYRDPTNWLDSERVTVSTDPTAIELNTLSTLQLGDTYRYMRCPTIVETYVDGEKEGENGEIIEFDNTRYIIAEARRSGESDIPNTDGTTEHEYMRYSPDDTTGVALYSAGPNDPNEHDHDGHLYYIYEDSDSTVTLSEDDEQYTDPHTLVNFELVDDDIDGSQSSGAEIEVVQEEDSENADTTSSETRSRLTVTAEPNADWSGDRTLAEGDSNPEPLPNLDVLVETPDGRRAGTDPKTGELIDEIDGAYITGQGPEQIVVVPETDGVDVTVSGKRLAAELRDRDVDFGDDDEIVYDQTTYVDTNPSLEEMDDGGVYIDGRIARKTTTSTEDDADTAATPADVSIGPRRLNAGSEGNFVTAVVELDEAYDPEDVKPASATLDDLQAVTDEAYDFVVDPTADDDENAAVVKFYRDEVVDLLGLGTHEVTISGLVGDTLFSGTAEFEVFESGKGPEKGDDHPGRGNPHDDDHPGRGPPEDGETDGGRGPPSDDEKSGRGNSGRGNSGKGNSGKGNSGKGKSGRGNSGKGKSGRGNSGKGNSGKGNSGKGK